MLILLFVYILQNSRQPFMARIVDNYRDCGSIPHLLHQSEPYKAKQKNENFLNSTIVIANNSDTKGGDNRLEMSTESNKRLLLSTVVELSPSTDGATDNRSGIISTTESQATSFSVLSTGDIKIVPEVKVADPTVVQNVFKPPQPKSLKLLLSDSTKRWGKTPLTNVLDAHHEQIPEASPELLKVLDDPPEQVIKTVLTDFEDPIKLPHLSNDSKQGNSTNGWSRITLTKVSNAHPELLHIPDTPRELIKLSDTSTKLSEISTTEFPQTNNFKPSTDGLTTPPDAEPTVVDNLVAVSSEVLPTASPVPESLFNSKISTNKSSNASSISNLITNAIDDSFMSNLNTKINSIYDLFFNNNTNSKAPSNDMTSDMIR